MTKSDCRRKTNRPGNSGDSFRRVRPRGRTLSLHMVHRFELGRRGDRCRPCRARDERRRPSRVARSCGSPACCGLRCSGRAECGAGRLLHGTGRSRLDRRGQPTARCLHPPLPRPVSPSDGEGACELLADAAFRCDAFLTDPRVAGGVRMTGRPSRSRSCRQTTSTARAISAGRGGPASRVGPSLAVG